MASPVYHMKCYTCPDTFFECDDEGIMFNHLGHEFYLYRLDDEGCPVGPRIWDHEWEAANLTST